MTCTERGLPASLRKGVAGGMRSALCAGIALAALALAPPASARVGVFFGFAPPLYYGPPPIYYPPPPIYYPPPPVYYTPPPPVTYTPPVVGPQGYFARTCYAGAYVCPMETRVSSGTTCWCPDNSGGRAYGRAQ